MRYFQLKHQRSKKELSESLKKFGLNEHGKLDILDTTEDHASSVNDLQDFCGGKELNKAFYGVEDYERALILREATLRSSLTYLSAGQTHHH